MQPFSIRSVPALRHSSPTVPDAALLNDRSLANMLRRINVVAVKNQQDSFCLFRPNGTVPQLWLNHFQMFFNEARFRRKGGEFVIKPVFGLVGGNLTWP